MMLLLVGAARGDEPPVRNRPAHFSEAVGSFDVTTEAKPTTVRLGQTLTLTVRVTATGPVQQPPRRPDLRDLAAFQDHFFIENLPGPDDDSDAPAKDKTTWVYAYRLKPRDTRVDAVPSFPFVFYKPVPPGHVGRGSFQTRFAPRIALTVQPAEVAPAPSEGTKDLPALQAPEAVYQIVEGSAVLRRPSAWDMAGPVAAVVVLAAVPVLCAGWYLLWRRRHPDAARLARRRRSLAARHALRALEGVRKQPAEEQPRQAATVVALYLRERVELPTSAPTPEEAARHLARAGVPPEMADAVAGFLRSCDLARFAPAALRDGGPGKEGWAAAAGSLIVRLEEESCPPADS
jgi:hypothetical protein